MRYFKMFSLFSVLLCSLYSTVQAQDSTINIHGKVLNQLNKPIENVNITLQFAKDSSFVKGSITNKEGIYIFKNIKPDQYRITFSGVGFKTIYSNVFNVSSQTIELPNTILQTTTEQLNNVVVTSNKPLIENKKGATILNVDASPTNAGTTALELLEKAPGVTVSNEGQISLKGKDGVLILIDGKPTYLSGNDLSNLLKNMPSSSIDQVEIMSNPPAKYDAAGKAGVINIKTKKNIIKGANGNISTSYIQGVYGKTTEAINLNYRNNKINVFGNYNYSHWEGFGNLNLDRNFYDSTKQIVSSSDQTSLGRFSANNHRTKIGLDYTINKKHIIGIVLNGSDNNQTEDRKSNSNIRDKMGIINTNLQSINAENGVYQNASGNLNYKGVLDSSGTELNVDVDYAHYVQRNNSVLQTNTFDDNGNMIGNPLLLDGKLPSFIRIYSGKADFTHPFKNGIKLEAGVKTSIVKSNNKVDYLRQQAMMWVPDSRSNHFIYEENINAGYVTASKEFKKWNVQLGLRIENTQSKGVQVISDTTFTRNYTNLFPNINIGYHLNSKNDINLSYSRRINRPDYENLNPFIFFLDSLTYEQGNPNLKPEINNNIELSHVLNGKFTTTINYSRTNDVITPLLQQNTVNKTTYKTTDNVNTLDNIGIAISAPFSIKKWWTVNTYANVLNNHYTGVYQNDPLNVSITSFLFNMTNTFTIKKGLTAEISGFYRSKGIGEGLFIVNPIYTVNAGISKSILHNKGTLKLTVRDIFYSLKFNGYTRYSDVDAKFNGNRDSRTANLTFTYRFGKQNIAAARKRTTGTTEEENRIKKGENNL